MEFSISAVSFMVVVFFYLFIFSLHHQLSKLSISILLTPILYIYPDINITAPYFFLLQLLKPSKLPLYYNTHKTNSAHKVKKTFFLRFPHLSCLWHSLSLTLPASTLNLTPHTHTSQQKARQREWEKLGVKWRVSRDALSSYSLEPSASSYDLHICIHVCIFVCINFLLVMPTQDTFPYNNKKNNRAIIISPPSSLPQPSHQHYLYFSLYFFFVVAPVVVPFLTC